MPHQKDAYEAMNVYPMEREGFQTVLTSGAWAIGANITSDAEQPCSVSRHLETDEAFTLLDGHCALFTFGSGQKPGEPMLEMMEKNRVYLVRKGVWHLHCMDKDTRLLIVEGSGTDDRNTDTLTLENMQQKKLIAIASERF